MDWVHAKWLRCCVDGRIGRIWDLGGKGQSQAGSAAFEVEAAAYTGLVYPHQEATFNQIAV